MPYEIGDRVIVDLSGLTSLRRPHAKGVVEGIVIQMSHPGKYDIMFFPHPPYPDFTIASFVPESLLRPAE